MDLTTKYGKTKRGIHRAPALRWCPYYLYEYQEIKSPELATANRGHVQR